MDTYEIHIVDRDFRTSRVHSMIQTSDFAAVRRANAMIPDGGGIEVWRGADCIYANYRDQVQLAG